MGVSFPVRLLLWFLVAVIVYAIGGALGVDPTVAEIVLVGLVFVAIDLVNAVLD